MNSLLRSLENLSREDGVAAAPASLNPADMADKRRISTCSGQFIDRNKDNLSIGAKHSGEDKKDSKRERLMKVIFLKSVSGRFEPTTSA